jgi:hypothetical protein
LAVGTRTMPFGWASRPFDCPGRPAIAPKWPAANGGGIYEVPTRKDYKKFMMPAIRAISPRSRFSMPQKEFPPRLPNAVIAGVSPVAPLEHRDGLPRWPIDQSGRQSSAGEILMSKKAAGHHKQVAEHLKHAAFHHEEAAKHHETGRHETAAHHAHVAMGHILHARGHAEEAVKAHVAEHDRHGTEQRRASA